MTDPRVVASVSQRLVNASRALGISHEMLMRRYAFERLLWRLAASPYAGELCLKGAMSFLAVTGDFRRPTKDMDFLGREPMPMRDAVAMFREIAATPTAIEDGLAFDIDGFTSEPIMALSEQPGTCIQGMVRLGPARIRLKLEIAYGDVLTPGAVLMDYPTVLDSTPPPRILVVSKETMLAEKFEAVCSLGVRNSRFKDFHDIRGLARSVSLDAATAASALARTFANRGTPLPETLPAAFLPAFASDGERGWAAFKNKQGIRDGQSFADLLKEIRPLVMGLSERALAGCPEGRWDPATGWEDDPEPDDRPIVSF